MTQGKQQLKEEIMDELKEIIAESIKKNVNGKIDHLTTLLTTHIERSEPVITAFNNFNWSTRTILRVVTFFAAIGGLVVVVRQIFK